MRPLIWVHPVDKPSSDAYGVDFGVFKTGIDNSITDVKGVKVGHVTLNYGKNVRTGVTAIIPHPCNLFRKKTPIAIFIGNGYGKLTWFSQVEELGNSETPIILTNTLSVPIASQALIEYTLKKNNNFDIIIRADGTTLYAKKYINITQEIISKLQ